MKRLFCAVCLLLAIHVSDAGERGLPAQEGILNFGKVHNTLFRGAQPDAAAIQNLKRLGVKSIISLCRPGKAWEAELKTAGTDGLVCTNIPMRGLGRPSDEVVRKVLAAIDSLPAPVFIHCQHGCDRTGTIIACHRIQHDHWTGAAALEEADRYGMSHLERGMRAFVADFSKTGKVASR